jgi:hypothetical protein
MECSFAGVTEMHGFLVLLPHHLEVENFCLTQAEEQDDCLTISAWAYRFLEGTPEVDECHSRMRLAIIRLVRQSDRNIAEADMEEMETDSLASMLTLVQLHKIWHESVLGIDASTRHPLQFTEVFRDDLQ